jgi:hypothetical protein
MPLHLTYGAQISVEDKLFSAYAEKQHGFTPGFPGVGFQFLDFEAGISDDLNPKLAEISPQGRAAPFIFASGPKNRRIEFTAIFMDETRAGEAFARARILQALKLPWHRENVNEPWVTEMFPPPLLRLTIDAAEISLLGHLSQCSVTYAAPLTAPEGYELGPKDQDPDFINVSRNPRARTVDAVYGSVPGSSESRHLVPSYITCTCTFIGDDVGPGSDFSADVFETGRLDERDW